MEALHRLQPDPTDRLLEAINPQNVERGLEELAKIGGKPWKSPSGQEYLGTNRLALSAEDEEARRNVVVPAMRAAGMHVDWHPLADIGTYHGTSPGLEPVVLMSHVDTVPDGDRYDGVLGVMSAIEVVRALGTSGLRPMRNIMVVSLTGEESARFKFPLFGSRALFHGLTSSELSARDSSEQTLREVLGSESAAKVMEPVFDNFAGYKRPRAVVELHVEQHVSLEQRRKNIGIVETIAAPERHAVRFGRDPIQTVEHQESYSYFELHVAGKANHSGATPMGDEHRADGLVATARFLRELDIQLSDLCIGDISVEGGSINKIPGHVATQLLVKTGNQDEQHKAKERLQAAIEHYQARLPKGFDQNAITFADTNAEQAGNFFDPAAMRDRQAAALATIVATQEAGLAESPHHTVATVGTYKTDQNGIITLELDVRGIDVESRSKAIHNIQDRVALHVYNRNPIDFGDALPGSGDPVNMNPGLVRTAESVIRDHGIGSSVRMFSAAGHDVQNAVRCESGVPGVMLFVPSHDGIAHRPDAYTSPEDIARGTYALGALALELANRP